MKHPSPFRSVRHWKALFKGRIPGQVVIQYTTRCNASCSQCGMRVSSRFQRATLDPDQVRRALDAMAARGVAAVSFTGGEPLLCLDEIAPLMRHAHAAGIPYVRTGTNGYIFRDSGAPDFEERIHKIAAALAETPLQTFWISLDSADPASHEENRGLPGVVEGIRKGLPIFHEHGIYPAANLGINRLAGGPGVIPGPWSGQGVFDEDGFYRACRTAFHRFYRHVLDLGFVTANACYPMSMEEGGQGDDSVYAATSRDDMIRFHPDETAALMRALWDTIPEFRHRLRIFTPRSALWALMRQHKGLDKGRFPCRGGIDFFFIGAEDMDTFPCGYRGGENLGKFWDLDMSGLDTGQVCEACDWECFRDPSVLAKPILEVLGNPLRAFTGLLGDRVFRRLWWEDMRYYRACEWFNARKRPDPAKLARFAPKPGDAVPPSQWESPKTRSI